jgi:hypothetical protein
MLGITAFELILIVFTQVMLIDPSKFHVFNELLTKECKGKGRIETMTFAATATVPADK